LVGALDRLNLRRLLQILWFPGFFDGFCKRCVANIPELGLVEVVQKTSHQISAIPFEGEELGTGNATSLTVVREELEVVDDIYVTCSQRVISESIGSGGSSCWEQLLALEFSPRLV